VTPGYQRLVGRRCARLMFDIVGRVVDVRTPAATSAHATQRVGARLRVGGTRQSEHHHSPQSSHRPVARSLQCFAHAPTTASVGSSAFTGTPPDLAARTLDRRRQTVPVRGGGP